MCPISFNSCTVHIPKPRLLNTLPFDLHHLQPWNGNGSTHSNQWTSKMPKKNLRVLWGLPKMGTRYSQFSSIFSSDFPFWSPFIFWVKKSALGPSAPAPCPRSMAFFKSSCRKSNELAMCPFSSSVLVKKDELSRSPKCMYVCMYVGR